MGRAKLKPLTAITIANLRPNKKFNYDVPDKGQRGLKIRIYTSGGKAFRFHYRFPRGGKRHAITLGDMELAAARKLASDYVYKLAQGIDPAADKKLAEAKAAGADSFTAVFAKYQSIDGKKLRTAADRNAIVQRLVIPHIGTMQIDAVRRGDILSLLDRIEDKNGPAIADRVLAIMRKVLNWHEVRNENYRSPIVRGMRAKTSRPRSRTLNDDELRAVWKASGDDSAFSALIRFLLLTAARRNEAARMTWAEIDGGDWVLPASRNKVNQDLVRPLSKQAQSVLHDQQTGDGCAYVFTNDGKRPLRGFGCLKTAFDRKCGIGNWTLHDLRRTARSLMSRKGVLTDHAEMVLGHKLSAIRGTYDRYDYHKEKAAALKALAQIIQQITNPQSNVVPLEERRA